MIKDETGPLDMETNTLREPGALLSLGKNLLNEYNVLRCLLLMVYIFHI